MPLNHTSQYAQLTEEQYAALGKVVVEWANIEELLGAISGRLLATPDFLARSFTDSISAVRIQTILTQAIEIHQVRYQCMRVHEAILNELTVLNEKVNTLRAKRNKIAHFCWLRSNDEELWGTNFPGGIPSPKSERTHHATFTANELAELHRESYAVVDQLLSIYQALPEINEGALLEKSN
ncbi:MAG TPA: hypothetical protein VFK88_04290 [Gallionella sp.]|nr:hypothetical protein [Gallionella sp.]